MEQTMTTVMAIGEEKQEMHFTKTNGSARVTAA
jgi:hypothetical protein